MRVGNHSDFVEGAFGEDAFPWMLAHLAADEVPEIGEEEGSGWQWNRFAVEDRGWIRLYFQNDRYRSEFCIDCDSNVSPAALKVAIKFLARSEEFQRYFIADREYASHTAAIRALTLLGSSASKAT